MCAEARRLVRALLQPDPTARLTAEQTLLHPWVKAMAALCRQGALTDRGQRDTTEAGAEAGRVLTNAALAVTDKTAPDRSREIIQRSGLSRHDERQPEENKGGDKEPGQQANEAIHGLSPQIKVQAPAEATPGLQKPECVSSRDSNGPEIQDPVLSKPDCDTPAQNELKQNSPQLSPPSSETESHNNTTHPPTLQRLLSTSTAPPPPPQPPWPNPPI